MWRGLEEILTSFLFIIKTLCKINLDYIIFVFTFTAELNKHTMETSKAASVRVGMTRIWDSKNLRSGDVIFIFRNRAYKDSKRSQEHTPRVNFMRVAAVRYVGSQNGRTCFAYDPPAVLIGSDSDTVLCALKRHNVLPTSYGLSIGINDEEHVYRLDNVRNLTKTYTRSNVINALMTL